MNHLPDLHWLTPAFHYIYKNITDCFQSIALIMVAGLASQIEYLATDGSAWRASLSEIRRGLFPGSTTEPVFCLAKADFINVSRKDAWIQYRSGDGSLRASRCCVHASARDNRINFKFEHKCLGVKNGSPSHLSDDLFFLDWKGQPWRATIILMDATGVPQFSLHPSD